MKKLRNLSLDLEKISLDAVRNVEDVNNSVHSLSLVGNCETSEIFHLLIGLFKNLRTLEIDSNSKLIPSDMQFNGMRIESLSFVHCLVEHHRYIRLQSLKRLSIDDASNITTDSWIQLASLNPNIEVLKIKDESICNEKFTAITQRMQNLIHFELFFDPQRLTSDILHFIADNQFPTNIKILKICERNPLLNQRYFQLTSYQKEKLNLRLGFQLYLG